MYLYGLWTVQLTEIEAQDQSVLVLPLSDMSCQVLSWSAVVVEMMILLVGGWDPLSQIYELSIVLWK